MTVAVVLSGGMDSTVAAYEASRRRRRDPLEPMVCITVDYGQRHRKEVEFAARTAERLHAEHVVVDLTSVGHALTSALTVGPDNAIPEGHYGESSMKATVVPNRNAILASVAYGIAVARQARFVWLGVHAGDHTIYPDCRPAFIERLSAALAIGSRWEPDDPVPHLDAPFVHATKAAIVRIGDDLGVPFEDTWSCYVGGDLHCGRCGTCVERAEAFFLAEVPDPTRYADPEFWRTAVNTHDGGPDVPVPDMHPSTYPPGATPLAPAEPGDGLPSASVAVHRTDGAVEDRPPVIFEDR